MKNTSSLDELLAEGRRLLKEGDKARALPFFELATRFNPEDKDLWLLRAEATEDPSEAASCLEQVVALDPENAQARDKLVVVRLNALQGEAQARTSRPPQGAPGSNRILSRGCTIWTVVGFFLLCALLGLGVPAIAILSRPPADTPVTQEVKAVEAQPTRTGIVLPATWTPSPTQVPSLTPTITPMPVWKTIRAVTVRSGPGTNYGSLGTLPASSSVVVVGRSGDSKFLQIQYPDANKFAWVAGDYVQISPAEVAAFPTALAQTTPLPPTRPPAAVAASAPAQPTATPTSAYEFAGRSPQAVPGCGKAPRVIGMVYASQTTTEPLNSIAVRVWAFGQPQGTPVTGSMPGGAQGYWEWNFSGAFDIDGEVAVVNPDGSLRSAKVGFHLSATCVGGTNQVQIDFVKAR